MQDACNLTSPRDAKLVIGPFLIAANPITIPHSTQALTTPTSFHSPPPTFYRPNSALTKDNAYTLGIQTRQGDNVVMHGNYVRFVCFVQVEFGSARAKQRG